MCLHNVRTKVLQPVEQNIRDKEALLRERRPNGTNTDELLELMADTRGARRAWISAVSPTITDIIRRFPRFQDLNSAVSIVCLCDDLCFLALFSNFCNIQLLTVTHT